MTLEAFHSFIIFSFAPSLADVAVAAAAAAAAAAIWSDSQQEVRMEKIRKTAEMGFLVLAQKVILELCTNFT